VIQTAKSALSTAPKKSTKIVKRLLETHQDLTNTVEALYVSLDIQESFPDLDGVDLEFVRTLLMARDLKINIRKRAIGSFFEWDRLDQAVGGRNQALGWPCQDMLIIKNAHFFQVQSFISTPAKPSRSGNPHF